MVEEMMRTTVQNHKALLASEGGVSENEGTGLVPTEKQGGKTVGYIYRLVDTDVRPATVTVYQIRVPLGYVVSVL